MKLPLHARRDIPEVWIVDINAGLVHFFRSPVQGNFSERYSTAAAGKMPLASFPQMEVDLAGLFDN